MSILMHICGEALHASSICQGSGTHGALKRCVEALYLNPKNNFIGCTTIMRYLQASAHVDVYKLSLYLLTICLGQWYYDPMSLDL